MKTTKGKGKVTVQMRSQTLQKLALLFSASEGSHLHLLELASQSIKRSTNLALYVIVLPIQR